MLQSRRYVVASLIALAALAIAAFGAASASAEAGPASGDGVIPEEQEKNPKCPTGLTALEVQGNTSGVYTDGTLTVSLVFRTTGPGTTLGEVVDWSSNIKVDQVIVKGGPDGNAYVYSPEDTGDTQLHAPINPSNGGYFGISHTTYCYDVEEVPPAAALTVSKDATPSFDRAFAWEIEKKADETKVEIADGGTAKFTYTVTVKHDEGTDSGWEVTGKITVNNPNSGAVTGVDVEDAIDDTNASCEVTGGTDAEIPAEGNEEFAYSCTYSEAPASEEQTNTATITWPEQTVDGAALAAGEAEGEAGIDWTSVAPSLTDEEIEVEDSVEGVLGTVKSSDSSPKEFEYTKEFEGVAGTCTKYDNKATFTTNDNGTEGSAEQTVEVCVGSDLEVEKNVATSFARKFPWSVSKKVDQDKAVIAEGGTAKFNYTIEFVKGEGEDSEWLAKGKITVSNPNDWQSVEVDVEDEIDDPNAVCTVEEGEDAIIPAGESSDFDYECVYSAAPEKDEQTNTATVTWDAEAASTPNGSDTGTAPIDWAATIPTVTDDCIEATDTLDGTPETLDEELCESKTFETEREFSGDPAGTCTEHNNTAAFVTNDTKDSDEASQEVEVCVGADLKVSKTASPSFTRTFPWSVSKEVDKTKITTTNGTATFKYTIKFTKGEGVDSGWLVKGTITVSNPNDWEAITADITDAIDDGGTCTVTGGEDVEIPAGEAKEVGYECTYAAAPEKAEATNTATATWNAEAASTPTGSATGTESVDWGTTKPAVTDDCIETTDTVDGVSTPLDEKLCESKTYEPELTFPVKSGCVSHDNTAAFKTLDSGTEGSASQKVEVCGPLDTQGRTMGFWQNKNGQKLITDDKETSKVCNLTPWLRQYNPFMDLSATANCKTVADYVTKIIKAASAGGAAMNAMLKGQMLATALSVYFSDPALGGNKLGASTPLGGVTVDLTKWSGGFGGATSMTVLEMLSYAAGQSNVGGTVWYGQVKATQGLAKDAFDAINNNKVFGP